MSIPRLRTRGKKSLYSPTMMPFRSLLLREFVRALIFTSIFLILQLIIGGIARAATPDGGYFGNLLSLILASNDWKNPGDGTVKNTQKLGGVDATNYQKVIPGQSCGGSQCAYGWDAGGNILCR